jgi:hypothetical protein
MTNLTATISETKLIDVKGRLSKDSDKFVAKCVLIDLRTGEHVITIEFHKWRNYRCDVFIQHKATGLHLVSTIRDSSKAYALVAVLRKVGITFEPRIWDICPDVHNSTPTDLVMNAIANTLAIPPESRTTVLAEAENINAR